MTFKEFASHIVLNPAVFIGELRIAVYVRSESSNLMALKPHLYSDLMSAVSEYGDKLIDHGGAMIVHTNSVAFWLQ